ncbi:hemolysin XhlA family protein [Aureibacillus halotolerans]|uniref:Hemolysin XhlA n=1 Tax=Aureibacillus halotolerans TaxID=1508390 RepID=A0A4R6TZ39_9BACI|nr:hemolysin XhlA family protein [Aureibacillus halotolerans]TDQ39248.1 hypothetical protein EV213_108200 [Aureibacillus halotolerans]
MSSEEVTPVVDNFLQTTVTQHTDQISDLKGDVKEISNRVGLLERHAAVTDERFNTLMGDVGEIKGDSKWVRRMLTKVMVGSVVGGIISAVVGFIAAVLLIPPTP